MPGIFGIIGTGPPAEKSVQLSQMLDFVKHDPDYQSGRYACEKHGLSVGWTCHKGSFCDRMPVWNEAEDICLIFSGEDFTDPSEIEFLRSRGHECSTGDADYLVHLYEEEGLEFLKKLNGSFSGLLLDLRQPLMVLFNDRYGLGRIYYHENPDGFYFCTEAKSLLRVLPGLRELDLDSLAETFSYGCVLGNKTLFPRISLLPAGSRWIFNSTRSPKKETYFDPSEWEKQHLLTGEEYYTRLRETFPRILQRYLRGPKPIAMSLTGGLDGRMIMAWADRPPGELPCYTFSGRYRDCTDARIARKVANLCGQPHETIAVGPSFFPEFPALAEKAVFISDGAMDVSGAVELYVNRIAKQTAPLRLTGNYGSEIVRRNVAFRPGRTDQAVLDPRFAELVRRSADIYGDERQGHKLTFIAFKQVPWHHYGRFSVERSQLTVRSPFLDNDLVSLVYQAPQPLAESNDVPLRLVADGKNSLSEVPTDRGILYRPVPVISKVANALMEFTYKSEYAYDYGMPQWLAKLDHFLAPLRLERIFLGRQKFYHFRVWYRDELSKCVKDILLDPRSLARPYLNRKQAEGIVMAHTSGEGNYTLEIHRLLTAELTQRQLLEMS
jgi:asparagine synthase (glutamine-hydrolysing)